LGGGGALEGSDLGDHGRVVPLSSYWEMKGWFDAFGADVPLDGHCGTVNKDSDLSYGKQGGDIVGHNVCGVSVLRGTVLGGKKDLQFCLCDVKSHI